MKRKKNREKKNSGRIWHYNAIVALRTAYVQAWVHECVNKERAQGNCDSVREIEWLTERERENEKANQLCCLPIHCISQFSFSFSLRFCFHVAFFYFWHTLFAVHLETRTIFLSAPCEKVFFLLLFNVLANVSLHKSFAFFLGFSQIMLLPHVVLFVQHCTLESQQQIDF